jgi:hypothetical protein
VKMTKPGVGGKPMRHGQFLVQILDLDHLRLGNRSLVAAYCIRHRQKAIELQQ